MGPPEVPRRHELPGSHIPWAVPAFRARSRWVTATIVMLLGALLGITLWLARDYERNEKQEALHQASAAAAAAIRARLAETERALRGLAADLRGGGEEARFVAAATELVANNPALLRVEHRAGSELHAAVDAPQPRPRLGAARRGGLGFDTQLALAASRGADRLAYSRPYPVQIPGELPFAVTELAVPVEGERRGTLLAIYALERVLENFAPRAFLSANEVMLSELDGTILARSASGVRGTGVYRSTVPIELAGGRSISLRADSRSGEPKLIPNLLAGMLVAAIAGLAIIGALLSRDVRLRARTERALRDQQAFRKAMEDSLVIGLRARGRHGEITYVNPAFCAMTGYDADELLGSRAPMPYWVGSDEVDAERSQTLHQIDDDLRQGFETLFRHKNGKIFPVLIFEAPLIDEHGEQAGWVGSILDVSEQKRIEELSRRQQEKLHQNARMALLGEVASSLSHELNQPLAAISGFATACHNLLETGKPADLAVALERIRSQSERAGLVIRSVNDFVRSRKLDRSEVDLTMLLQALAPLIELQARKFDVRVAWTVQPGTAVLADRTMLEQVILNLTRNAIESMEQTPIAQRLLEIDVTRLLGDGSEQMARIAVLDRGHGVSAEAQAHLFSAFYSTKPQGLGIGLSLCRSVVEQHGGQLHFSERPGGGTIFSATIGAIRLPPP